MKHLLEIDVRDFGATCNGEVDDSEAIQKAIDSAFKSGGGSVRFPTGNYLIQKKAIYIKKGVALIGSANLMGRQSEWDTHTFLITYGKNSTTPTFLMEEGACIKGFTFFYPDQKSDNETPVEYGFTISTNNVSDRFIDGIEVSNIMLTNSYRGIKIEKGGQFLLENIFGRPINIGIQLDKVYDVGRINNIHFWPFWKTNTKLTEYIRREGIALLIGKVDNVMFNQCFAFGYKSLFLFKNLGNGAAWAQLSNIIADQCFLPIEIEEANNLQFQNLNLIGIGRFSGADYGLEISGKEYKQLSFTNATFANTWGGIKIKKGTRGDLLFHNIMTKNSPRESGKQTPFDNIWGYSLVNESDDCKVQIANFNNHHLSGAYSENNEPIYKKKTDITKNFPQISNLKQWKDTQNKDIGVDYLVLGKTIQTIRYNFPKGVLAPDNKYILQFNAKFSFVPNTKYGPIQCYIRLVGNTPDRQILLFPVNVFEPGFRESTLFQIPFSIPDHLLEDFLKFEIVFGGSQESNILNLSEIKIFRYE